MKRTIGLNIKYLLLGLICMLVLVFVGVTINHRMLAKWQPDPKIVGTWIGSGESGKFGEKEKIKVSITIDETGLVNGKVGEASLEASYMRQHRNDFERFIHVKNDYIIQEGHISGKINAEDDIAYRDITIPFNIQEGIIKGTLFQVERFKYPDPLLLHVELEKIE